MKTLELQIDDNCVEVVLSILDNLKDGLIQNIKVNNIEKSSDLEDFRKLIRNGNNKKILKYEDAVSTEEMIDDIF